MQSKWGRNCFIYILVNYVWFLKDKKAGVRIMSMRCLPNNNYDTLQKNIFYFHSGKQILGLLKKFPIF